MNDIKNVSQLSFLLCVEWKESFPSKKLICRVVYTWVTFFRGMERRMGDRDLYSYLYTFSCPRGLTVIVSSFSLKI